MRASQCISYYLNSLLCIQDNGYRPFLYLKGNYAGSLSRFYSLSQREREQEKRGACSDLSRNKTPRTGFSCPSSHWSDRKAQCRGSAFERSDTARKLLLFVALLPLIIYGRRQLFN